MKGLLIKDCYVIWKQAKFTLVLIALYLIIGAFNSNSSFWISFSALFISTMPVTAMGLDERCKWDKYEVMLPYSRKDIVLSKYILGITCSFLTIIFYGIVKIGVMAVMKEGFQPLVILYGLFPYVAAPFFFLGLNFPIMFKLGVEKGRMWFILSMVIFMVGATATMEVLKDTVQITSFIEKINLNGSILQNIGGIAAAISIIFILASSMLSVRIYENKEI